jgi:uncharacterized membrane protein YphA (DoxX/SURF4 family)
MKNMDDSMAQPLGHARPVDVPRWKLGASHVAGVILALLFLTSGLWKLTDPFRWRTMVEQLLVPYSISMPLTLAVGITETLAGVMILVPRFRRWGAWLVAILLLGFMAYFAINYTVLTGKDCSCFPWVKRTVGPGFFIGDAAMLAVALIAGAWAPVSRSVRSAAVVLGAIVVFAGVLFGFNAARQAGTKAPQSTIVDGKPYSLQHGRTFLYFYDPECMHCDRAARTMSKYKWKPEVQIIGLPTREKQFAAAFLSDTGLSSWKAVTSLEAEKLKQTFPFGDPPYGVALENGREVAAMSRFEENEPADSLKKIGFID